MGYDTWPKIIAHTSEQDLARLLATPLAVPPTALLMLSRPSSSQVPRTAAPTWPTSCHVPPARLAPSSPLVIALVDRADAVSHKLSSHHPSSALTRSSAAYATCSRPSWRFTTTRLRPLLSASLVGVP